MMRPHCRRVATGRRATKPAKRATKAKLAVKRPTTDSKKFLLLLRNHCGVDFSLYKSTTIQRRIARRMVLNKQDSLEDYAQFLRGNPKNSMLFTPMCSSA